MKFCLVVLVSFCILSDFWVKGDSCSSEEDEEEECECCGKGNNKKCCEEKGTLKILLTVIVCVIVITVIIVLVVCCCWKKKQNAKRVADMELNQIQHTQCQPPPYFVGQQGYYSPGSSDQAGPLPAKN